MLNIGPWLYPRAASSHAARYVCTRSVSNLRSSAGFAGATCRFLGEAWEGAVEAPSQVYIIVYPPLTDSVWPVMKLAASEARKTMAGATSSGLPIRRSG